MTLVTPTIIQGPVYLGHGGVVLYFKDGVTIEEQVETWTPESTVADLGERLKSRMFKITGTPVGMITSAILNYFYEAHLAPQTYVGVSIIPASNYALTLYSVTENKTYGYVRAGLSQPPDFYCGPSQTAFGSASWMAIGAAASAPTITNFLKATAGTIGSADTSFNGAKVESDIYQGVLGTAGSAPYNSLGGMDGFLIKFGFKTKPIPCADTGIGDIILDSKGFNTSVTFAPSNLTEAQVDTLCNYQGTNALLPGQAFGSGYNQGNLVMTGLTFGWVFTVTQVGAKSAKRIYQIGEHRFPKGALEFVNALTVTTGVPNPLFSFTAGT